MNENEVRLRNGLKLLAATETRLPSLELEAKLLRQIRPAKKRWPVALAIAASILLAVFIREEYSRKKPVEEAVKDVAAPVASTPLMPIPFAEPLYGTEHTELVRVNIPVAQLLSWGLSTSGSDPNATVNADVLLGEDGLARAVRLVE